MSQYIVSVEFSSLIYHRSYPWFVCFLCSFIDADERFRSTAEANGEGLDPVKHV